jgi:hypothetical protein
MLIQTRVDNGGNLHLSAYTFSEEEFASLHRVLRTAQINPSFNALPSDATGRPGRRYRIALSWISALETVLGGRFDGGSFVPGDARGARYACREVRLGGAGVGCKELVAPDQDVAAVQCALIARDLNWLGSAARLGRCGES